MQQFSSQVEGGLMGRPGRLSVLLTLFFILLFLSQSVTAGAFEQGMTSLEKGDFAEAYCVWRPLATQGHAQAAYHLGWLYANGNGLRVDITQAIHWWSQAASQGHTDAQFALGLAYTSGEGIKADPEKALDWYLKAANGGHQDAREIIRTKVMKGAVDVQARLPELVAKEWLGQPIRVTVDKVNLRSGPGTTFSQVGVAAKGSILKAIGERGEWYQVLGTENGAGFSWIAGWLTEPVE